MQTTFINRTKQTLKQWFANLRCSQLIEPKKQHYLRVLNPKPPIDLVDFSDFKSNQDTEILKAQKHTTLVDIYDPKGRRQFNMKSVMFSTPKLLENGPIVTIELYPDLEQFLAIKNNGDNPDFYTMSALIDTGANISSFDSSIIEKLNLKVHGQKIETMGHSNELQEKHMYQGILYIDIFRTKGLPISFVEHDFKKFKEPYLGIIGRDVLQHCSLVYDGWNNSFKLTAISI